jgi:hypothetical protein
VSSPSQRPLPTQDNTTRKNEEKLPCVKRDSNTRSQRPSDQGLCLRWRGHGKGKVKAYQEVLGRTYSMLSHPYKMSSKSTNRFKSFTHLRGLNVRHFGMVEVMALNSMEYRSPLMSSPPLNISSKSTNRFKVSPTSEV